LQSRDFSRVMTPLKEVGEITMECEYELQEIQWNVEYAVGMFTETMTKKERAAVDMNGYLPVTRDGEVVGRAYLSKFEPVKKNNDAPAAQISILPKGGDNGHEESK
jgi:hypothetical protein